MIFEMKQKVLFKHCDPAGIVFYPRYFEMMNDCVEAFFDEALQVPFETLHKSGNGSPTAQIETRFARPSYHGDHLVLRLCLSRVGPRSATYRMKALCADETRFDTTATLVHVDSNGKSTPWPDDMRSRMQEYEDQLNDT